MTGTADDVVFKLRREGKSTKAQVIVELPGGDLFVDRVDLVSDVSRRRFTKKICEKYEGIDVNDIQPNLDAAAASALGANGGSVADGADDADGADGADDQSALSQADLVVQLCRERFRLGRTLENEPFAVERAGLAIARMLRGGRRSLRAELASEFQRKHGKVPNSSALTDALMVVEGEAMRQEAEPVHLRVARHEDSVVLDLGATSGAVAVVEPDSWRLVDTAPTLFRHTELTDPLPAPVHGGSLDSLRPIINVDDDSWPLLVGWLVAALLPDVPHPIVLLGGQQGCGKSTTARFVVSVIDPSPAPLRTCPRDLEQWAVAAYGSWVVVIDNISRVPEWWSDALCRAVTGDGLVKRKLYSDSGLSVLAYQRVLMLTSIDPGALRGDLGDRIVLLDVKQIPEHNRLPEAQLKKQFERQWPAILGGLLDLLARVLAVLPQVRLERHARMADFCVVLAAVDRVLGTQALDLYLRQRERIAADVVEGDPVADAVRRLVVQKGQFTGTATELRGAITPEPAPRGWPRDARALGAALRRCVPALGQLGVVVEFERDTGRNRDRLIHIERDQGAQADSVQLIQAFDSECGGTGGPADVCNPTAQEKLDSTVRSVRASENPSGDTEEADCARTMEGQPPSEAGGLRPHRVDEPGRAAQGGVQDTVRSVRPSDRAGDDSKELRTTKDAAPAQRPPERPQETGPDGVVKADSDGADATDDAEQLLSGAQPDTPSGPRGCAAEVREWRG